MRGARALAALVAGIAVLALAAPASATFPGRNGFVAFISDRDGDFELYAQNLDGSNVRKLLARPGTTEGNPAWSPSGKRLVFHSGPPDESNFDLYLLNADGTALTPLVLGPENDLNAQFCDADTVVFQRANATLTTSDIYAIETDGTGLRVLTDHPAIDFGPTCTPDGTAVAFASTRAADVGIYQFPLAPAAGRSPAGAEPILLVSPAIDPDHSPDGKSLAYAAPDPVDGSTEVFVRDLATAATRQISFSGSPLINRFPRFFPDQGGAGPLVVWTQLGPTARVPAGDNVNGSDDKNSQSNAPVCNGGNEDGTVGRPGLGPLGVLELCFKAIANGGVAVIRPLPIVPICQCKSLSIDASKKSFGSAEGQTAGRRLTRLFFTIEWQLRCSAGIARPGCRGNLSLDPAEGFTIASMHRLEKKGKKTVRVPDPNPVECKGRCDRTRETVTRGTIRVAVSSRESLAELAGDRLFFVVEMRCVGRTEEITIQVFMGQNGKVKKVLVRNPF